MGKALAWKEGIEALRSGLSEERHPLLTCGFLSCGSSGFVEGHGAIKQPIVKVL
jgi:hypothetical protein